MTEVQRIEAALLKRVQEDLPNVKEISIQLVGDMIVVLDVRSTPWDGSVCELLAVKQKLESIVYQ